MTSNDVICEKYLLIDGIIKIKSKNKNENKTENTSSQSYRENIVVSVSIVFILDILDVASNTYISGKINDIKHPVLAHQDFS